MVFIDVSAIAGNGMTNMAVGDLYMVKDKQRNVQGVELLNVYFYQGTGDGISSHLGTAFLETIVPAVAAMQAIDVSHYEVEVASLFDPTDFAVQAIDEDGTWAVETSAPFLAVNYTFRIPTRAIRPGSKRIGPVPEDAVVNGVINDVDYLVVAEATRDAMGDILAPAGDPSATFAPVVVKRVRSGTSPNYHYRLPTSYGEAEYAYVTFVNMNLNVSHQVSREL